MFARNFQDLGKDDSGLAGGKGASLGEMTQAGIPVPPGFVVLAAAFEHFLEATDLNVEIDNILHGVDQAKMHTVEHASETIQQLILEAKMPADIVAEALADFRALGTTYVAVRSSATAEDSASAAWAGQLDSFLNTTEETLLRNIQRCWASLFTPRAIFYRFEKNLHSTKISVAVVVQKMVESEVSGIAFSVHPVTEDRNQLIIEAGYGLGEAIVSGQVTPDSYVVEKVPRRIIDKNIADQERGIYRSTPVIPGLTRDPGDSLDSGSQDGMTNKGKIEANEWRTIPSEKRSLQKLSDDQILELSELILRIEQHYGFPCDIEWAFEAGKFYIVQSRPITTLRQEIEVKETRVRKFSVFVEDRDVPLNPWCVLNDVFRKSLSELSRGDLPPLDNLFYFEEEVVLWGADADQFSKAGKYFSNKLKENPAFLDDISNGLNNSFEFIKKFSKELTNSDLSKKTERELFALYDVNYQTWTNMWAWGLVGQFIDMGEEKLSDKVKNDVWKKLEKFGNPEIIFSKLVSPTEPNVLTAEINAVLNLARDVKNDKLQEERLLRAKTYTELPKSISDKLEALSVNFGWLQYYYLGPAATPDYYFDLLKRKIHTAVENEIINREQESRDLKDLQTRVCEGLSEGEVSTINSLKDLSLLKELRKEYSFLLNFAMDRWYEEVSKRFSLNKLHTRYLLPKEFRKMLVDGELSVTKEEMQKRYACCSYLMVDGKDEIYSGDEARGMRAMFSVAEEKNIDEVSTLKGAVAYHGGAKGTVKIVNSKHDMVKFNEGDILVSISTNPSLVPAMNKAAAIVTDTGGITCHAAIVSRELKIPCVVGTKIATRVLKDGDLVEVDADNGVVRILKR